MEVEQAIRQIFPAIPIGEIAQSENDDPIPAGIRIEVPQEVGPHPRIGPAYCGIREMETCFAGKAVRNPGGETLLNARVPDDENFVAAREPPLSLRAQHGLELSRSGIRFAQGRVEAGPEEKELSREV